MVLGAYLENQRAILNDALVVGRVLQFALVDNAEYNRGLVNALIERFVQHVILAEFLVLEVVYQAFIVHFEIQAQVSLPDIRSVLGGAELVKGLLELRYYCNVLLEDLAKLCLDRFYLGVPITSNGCARNEAHRPLATRGCARSLVESAFEILGRASIVDVGSKISFAKEYDQLPFRRDFATAVGKLFVLIQVHGDCSCRGNCVELGFALFSMLAYEAIQLIQNAVNVSD